MIKTYFNLICLPLTSETESYLIANLSVWGRLFRLFHTFMTLE